MRMCVVLRLHYIGTFLYSCVQYSLYSFIVLYHVVFIIIIDLSDNLPDCIRVNDNSTVQKGQCAFLKGGCNVTILFKR